jgi:hypothetical protein
MKAINHYFDVLLPFFVFCVSPMVEVRPGGCDNAQDTECWSPNRMVWDTPAFAMRRRLSHTDDWEIKQLFASNMKQETEILALSFKPGRIYPLENDRGALAELNFDWSW